MRLEAVERLAERVVGAGADRQSLVIALGGGVVGDCAGFLAAIFLRGIPVVQIPTTLLAQVDASIGGENPVAPSPGQDLFCRFFQSTSVLSPPHRLSPPPPPSTPP